MLAESFATLVGLLGQYYSEKGAKAELEYNDFMEWLVKANHTEIRSLLELNTQATIHIKALLNQDHRIFKEKLDKIDAAITTFASAIDGFDALAREINPSVSLSAQAINILEQFQQSGATKLFEMKLMSGTAYQFLETSGGLEVTEQNFIEDDLKTLVEYGLLRHEYNKSGNNIFMFTRAGSRLIQDK